MTGNEFQNKAQDAAKAVKDAGRETFDAAKSELSEAAKEVKSTLRDEAETRARAGKDLVADQGQRIARDLRDAAGSQGVESFQGRLLDTVASGVSDISEGLRDQSLSSILEQAERFARRNPGAFVAGAAIVGFSLARFARASERSPEQVKAAGSETGNILAAEQRRFDANHSTVPGVES